MLIFFQNLESQEVNGYDLVEIEGVSTVVVESESFRENRASYCKQRSNPNEVIWAEEFSSGKLDKEIWDYDVSNGFYDKGKFVYGWGNSELQYYSCLLYTSPSPRD